MFAHGRTIALVAALGAAVSGFVVRADEVDDLFRAAAEHYSQRQWQAACDDFAKLLATAPDDARATQVRFHYGEGLVQLKRYADARAQFDAVLERDPAGKFARQALYRSGEAAYLAGDRSKAQRQLQTFFQQHPDDPLNAFALCYLGRLELDERQPQAAQRHFAAAVARFPQSALVDQCQWGLAEAQAQQKHLDEAYRTYKLLADARGRYTEHALLRLAALDNERRDHAAALAWLDRLAKEFPEGALADRAALGRGYALYKLGRSTEAEGALNGLLKHPQLGVDAHYWLGMSQFSREAWKEAAATFAAGAVIDSQHRWNETLSYQAACALLNDGQYGPAAAQFDRVLDRWPKSAWAEACWLGKLQAAAAQNDHAAVVQLANELAAKFPAGARLSEAEAIKGRALAALGKHAEAAKALEDSLASSATKTPQTKTADAPKRRTATEHELAVQYAETGRFAEAATIVAPWYEKSPAPSGPNDATCYRVAELAYAANDLPTAEKLFALLAAQSGASDSQRRGLLGVAWCRYKAQDWQQAADAFGKLLERFPAANSAAEAALLRGRSLEHLDDAAAALGMYRRVMDRHPDSARAAEAIYRAAGLHEQQEQPSAAIEMYRRLVDEHKDFERRDAALYRWAHLARAAEPETAARLYARLQSEFPNSQYAPEATLHLAEQAYAEKQYERAGELVSRILAGQSSAAVRQQAQYLAGRVAAAQEKWDDVETSLAQLIEESPDCEWALAAAYLRAEASYRRGRYAESAERLAALARDDGARQQTWSAAAQLRRAQALVQLKQWHEALEVARTLAAQSPDFGQQHEVDYVIGRCLAAQADLSGARTAYQKVLRSPRGAQSETAALAQWMIGETYFHQEDYSAALAEYEKMPQQFPTSRVCAAALLQAGKCHEQLGHWDKALVAYRQLMEKYPTNELSAEAARRVELAQAHVARRTGESN
jgi:TolA-binding protein